MSSISKVSLVKFNSIRSPAFDRIVEVACLALLEYIRRAPNEYTLLANSRRFMCHNSNK